MFLDNPVYTPVQIYSTAINTEWLLIYIFLTVITDKLLLDQIINVTTVLLFGQKRLRLD